MNNTAYFPCGTTQADVDARFGEPPELPDVAKWFDNAPSDEQGKLLDAVWERMDYVVAATLLGADRRMPPALALRTLCRWREALQEEFERLARNGEVSL